MMWLFFINSKLSSFRFSYPTKNAAVAEEIRRELESRFGDPKFRAFNKQTKVQIYKWNTPAMACYLLVPMPESARGAALTVSVNSKETAVKMDKSLTLTPYTKPDSSPSTLGEKKRAASSGFHIVPLVILAAVIAAAAMFFLRRKAS